MNPEAISVWIHELISEKLLRHCPSSKDIPTSIGGGADVVATWVEAKGSITLELDNDETYEIIIKKVAP